MQFEGFAGNAALKTALSAAFSRRRLPHTLLLQGEAGRRFWPARRSAHAKTAI